jgi:hypothetical protein
MPLSDQQRSARAKRIQGHIENLPAVQSYQQKALAEKVRNQFREHAIKHGRPMLLVAIEYALLDMGVDSRDLKV